MEKQQAPRTQRSGDHVRLEMCRECNFGILERVTILEPDLGGGRKKTVKLEVTQDCRF